MPGAAFAALMCLFCGLLPAAQAEPRPLVFGILPYTAAIELANTHEPLRRHLEAAVGQPVTVRSAVDYASFVREAAAGRYDLLLTAPHFAPLAVEAAGYRPILRYQRRLAPILIVRNDSGISEPGQIKGKRLACPNRLSLACVIGLHYLNGQRLRAGQDYEMWDAGSHANAILAVYHGKADTAVTSHTPLRQLSPEVQTAMRQFPLNAALPHMMFLAHRDLAQAQIERLALALRSFGATVPGQRFYERTGYIGVADIDADDWVAVQPYAREVRALLGGRP